MNDKPLSILFVDDEPGILKALRRLFMDEDWQIFLAASGQEGLEILAREPVDLVVSDVRMPEMNGIEFLLQVKEKYPDISRVFLSGYAEKDKIAEALAEGCALQIIPKPWEDDELREIICNLLDQKMHTSEDLETLDRALNSFANLPPLPAVYQELKTCLADRENFTIDQVAEIVRQDIAISTDLLHWANSALFGQRRKVDTVKRAIMLLGVEIVECLVLSESIQRALGERAKGSTAFDAERLQRHSMSCATLARLLATEDERCDENFVDRAFIAGLLHDLGLLAVASMLPEQFNRIDELVSKGELTLVEAEAEVLHTTHAQVGAHLADRWSLPPELVKAIRWHHEPLAAPPDSLLARLIATADWLAVWFGNSVGYEQTAPTYTQELSELFQLTPQRVDGLREDLHRMLGPA